MQPTTLIEHDDYATLTYASGTWTLSKVHERLRRSAQRKVIRLMVQLRDQKKTTKIQMKTKQIASPTKKPKEDQKEA